MIITNLTLSVKTHHSPKCLEEQFLRIRALAFGSHEKDLADIPWRA